MTKDIIDSKKFMELLEIKSPTTFNKRVKEEGFPEAIEWPPKSRCRGWYLIEAEAYLAHLVENAKRWSEVGSQNGSHAN